MRNLRKIAAGLFLGTIFATTASAATYGPALPLTGWATQNGGTTGGAGKTVVTVSNVDDLRKYAEAGNYTIYVKPGTYKVPSKSAIKVGDNVTIYGYRGAIIEQTRTSTNNEDNTALNITGKNIIIRNLTFKGAGSYDLDAGDCLHVQGGVNVWIDHVDVYDGQDGNLDVINGANYVTISWTKFHYTNASSNHQFSNLVGNSDNKTSDAGKLKTTFHHNWWADGSKERMPRVRYGQVHVANNLFNSNNASYCVRAGMKADIRVESNVFIGVKNPLDYNNQSKEDAKVSMVGNYFEKISGNTAGQGTAFTPAYKMSITDVGTQAKAYALRDSIMLYAGATLPDPGSNEVTPVSSTSQPVVTSSSSTKSSSSTATVSSSSVKTSSSSISPVAGVASLTKHGSGSATQTVAQGQAIVELYYTITGATGATVSGLPAGVSGILKGSDFHISGTVSATAEAKAYKWTVTTTGGSSNVSKSGTFTVTAAGSAPTVSSSSQAVTTSSADVTSSSNPTDESSSSKLDDPSNIENDTDVEDPSLPESSDSNDPGHTMSIAAAPIQNFIVQASGRSISIQGAEGKKFAIFDMQGKFIRSGKISSNQFKTDFRQSGTYLIRIDNKSSTVKIR